MPTESKIYASRSILSAEEGSARITERIRSGTPSAIGKIGGTECRVLNYCERLLQFDWPRQLSWKRAGQLIYELSGVYPFNKETFYRFAKYFRGILPECDLLVAWHNKGEEKLLRRYAPQAELIGFESLDPWPFLQPRPWTAALAGKKVLLISPFTETARRQHTRQELVWPDHPELRPKFDLLTLRTPLYSHMLEKPVYADWFAGLSALTVEMDSLDYDVAIVGCGAWSLPLCVQARRRGKIGIHLGGSAQILFGIRGKRWEERSDFRALMNESWVRPSGDECPPGIGKVEGACYW